MSIQYTIVFIIGFLVAYIELLSRYDKPLNILRPLVDLSLLKETKVFK